MEKMNVDDGDGDTVSNSANYSSNALVKVDEGKREFNIK